MNPQRIVNLVGAMALSLTDEIATRTEALTPRDEPAAAIAIIGRSPAVTIRALSVDLGRSHAATVRLVDRLAADQLVVRRKSPLDGRAVELRLTADGELVHQRILAARHDRLGEILAALTETDRTYLGSIAEKVLVAIATGNRMTGKMCRLCDAEQCRTCPIDAVRCA